jgi:hypothetical protein
MGPQPYARLETRTSCPVFQRLKYQIVSRTIAEKFNSDPGTRIVSPGLVGALVFEKSDIGFFYRPVRFFLDYFSQLSIPLRADTPFS